MFIDDHFAKFAFPNEVQIIEHISAFEAFLS